MEVMKSKNNLKDIRRVSLLRMCQELLVDIIKGQSVTVRVHEENYKKLCGRSYKQILREMRLALIDSEYPDPNNYSEEEKEHIQQHGFRRIRRMN